MFSPDGYLGCPRDMNQIITTQSQLCLKVVQQVNESQELMMIEAFTRENNEYLIKKCLQERISEIASWHWVLSDLSKRLEEAISALQYEHNALRVVISRIEGEIEEHSRTATRPGALCPLSDAVEEAVLEEYKYLREQKKRFEIMIEELDIETKKVAKVKKRIDDDVLSKQKAIEVEEKLVKSNLKDEIVGDGDKKKIKKKCSPLERWEKRCSSLKSAGLRSLSNAISARKQVRGARVQLSITAQAHVTTVDTALRRRLHANTVKLEELKWQRDEAVKDLTVLEEEQNSNEQNLLEKLDKIRLVESRLKDRKLRPAKELTRDEVDKTLRSELARLRRFTIELRDNNTRLITLKNNMLSAITKIDDIAEDVAQVVSLDKARIHYRLGEEKSEPVTKPSSVGHGQVTENTRLDTIDENEEEDYPFDY